MRLETCTFQEEEGGILRRGILIDEGHLIINEDGDPVKDCWVWNRIPTFAATLFIDDAAMEIE